METYEKIDDKTFRKIVTDSSETVFNVDDLIQRKQDLLNNLANVTNITNSKVSELDILINQAQQLALDTSIPLVPEPIPQTVTMRQARLILLQYNMLDTVNNIINSMDDVAKTTWEYSYEIDRSNPLFAQITSAANMTESQIDQMFLEASKL